MKPLLSRSSLLASVLAVAALLSSNPASAAECKADKDCPDGFRCEKSMSVPGCATPPDCPDPQPVESETGFCEKAPQSCQTDADCPQFTKCLSSQDSICWADSSGDGGCLETDPNAPKVCAYAPVECQNDAECPANFACTLEPPDCAPIACTPGDECTPPPCETSGKQFCEPKAISCQANTDCPADWTCLSMESDCLREPAAPGTGDDVGDASCSSDVVKLCSPAGFSEVGEYRASADQAGGNPTAPAAAPADDDGGCSMPARPASGAGASLLLLAALGLLARSRRSS